jgi:hypothetical protein
MAPRFVEMPGSALERGVEFFASSLPAWGVTDAVGLLQQRALHLIAVDGETGGERESGRERDVPAVCQHGDEEAGPERNACSAASSPPRWFSYSRSPPPLRRKSGGGGGTDEAVAEDAEDAEEAENAEEAEEAEDANEAKGRRQKRSLTRTANAMLAAGTFMGAVYRVVLRRRAKHMHGSVKWR